MRYDRLLIVSPAFHGYWRSYEAAFSRLGYSVRTLRYDSLDGMIAKIKHKLRVELADRLGRDGRAAWANAVTARCISALRSFRPDRVLIIRGDLLGPTFWEAVEEVGTHPLTLIFDEVERMDITYDQLISHGPVASYSAHDTAELTARGAHTAHVQLAFDPYLHYEPVRRDEVVFIGALYGDRGPAISALHHAGVPVRAYGRDWSHHPVDRLRTWNTPRPALPASRDVTRTQAYGIQAGARASINIHAAQDGFTMRTYEIPGVGGLQLIDRDDVANLYDPGSEVLVFHSHDELIELAQRAGTDRAWAAHIREAGRRRTLAEHTFDHRAAQLETLWD